MQSTVKINFSYQSHQSTLGAIDNIKYSQYREGYASLTSEQYPPKETQTDEQRFFLSVIFNKNSIDFQICDYSLDDWDEMVLRSKTIKAASIVDELNLYIGVVDAFYNQRIRGNFQDADQIRRDAHEALAKKIDAILKEDLQLDLNTMEDPSMLAKDILTRWLHMRGLTEESAPFNSPVKSCAVFAKEAKIDRRHVLGR